MKFLLDSGDPQEYKEIATLAKAHQQELWGSTTNPTLIAKKLAGRQISQEEAFQLQKQIVLEILTIVPGAVSAEVYADETTRAQEMIAQGREIALWHKRVVVKLPTSLEGFKARTVLRKEGIPINNTLVFSQEQIFAICLHEQLIQKESGPLNPAASLWPCFISPFVGRLDDQNEDGLTLVEHGMYMKKTHGFDLWMLEASVRKVEHIKRGIDAKVELITAPAKLYKEWFALSKKEQIEINTTTYATILKPLEYWEPPQPLLELSTIDDFMKALTTNIINIHHPLTHAGIIKFAKDWKAIIAY